MDAAVAWPSAGGSARYAGADPPRQVVAVKTRLAAIGSLRRGREESG